MIEESAAHVNLEEFCHTLNHFLEQDDYSLTMRQLGVLLTCYLLDEEHTVRRLAASFGLSKPTISRVLDHLVGEGLIERQADPVDRRSVLFVCTTVAKTFLERMEGYRPAITKTCL
jgi:DNA-binding MarR family transcriptional regulator